ncbi:hypothetical protein [Pseudomonas sp. KNUC1026]|uniref:hypothetical protein n=1 Tax=Pseudomonas sp. KNUC1026 TaxID=2893890 RepID=UPI001F279597|nr:hypothetical protein [Pseudomonas sp. KNUC1026]UFH50455.1 hypothetical protein LN139_04200 [Pseudomonas sp. KNUC1026]
MGEFGVFDTLAHNVFHATLSTAAHRYDYWLASQGSHALVVASQDMADADTAVAVLESAPKALQAGKPNLFELRANQFGFTHVLAVPGDYHGHMNGHANLKRESLFLCVPIRRFEFSGEESAAEFRMMNGHLVPVLDWSRLPSPKTILYFDNPKTGGGTEDSVVVRYESLLHEIENLNGVAGGFIEITNYKGGVIELLSPEEGVYELIRNRAHGEFLEHPALLASVQAFLAG